MKLPKQEAVKYIQDFLEGNGYNRDWDDFISIRITNDPQLEKIRLRCAGLREEFPPKHTYEYCGTGG